MNTQAFDPRWLDDPRDIQRDACGVGFIAHLKGRPSHSIVKDGLEILRRLDHRGGCAADGKTSDGAGLLLQIPRAFLAAKAAEEGLTLPEHYALAQCFPPPGEAHVWLESFRKLAAAESFSVVWERRVPVDATVLGPIAAASEPEIWQLVLKDQGERPSDWRLYRLRKALEQRATRHFGLNQHQVYIASLSQETVVYKGLVRAENFSDYFLDLQDERFQSALSLVHQRFSTNTLPSWPLAQPFRLLCHNGEINTLRGNMNAMHARSSLLRHENLEGTAETLHPICVPGFSDSAMLDNTLEFLQHTGRSLTESLSMLIPEPWERSQDMPEALRAYYEYQSYRMEPWDGPAFVGFCDGTRIGAVLDRNGLRPGRYWVTCDEHVIMASEAGVLDRRPEEIVLKGRLSPGRIFMVDLERGEIIPDHVLKKELAEQDDYRSWLKAQRSVLQGDGAGEPLRTPAERDGLLQVFGYTVEDLRTVLAPMAMEGKEPVGSMGSDLPLAVLSTERPLLYDYFKQLFAQVTNPPIDAIREELVTSLSTYLGRETNLFVRSDAPVIRLEHPLLLASEMRALRRQTRLKTATLLMSFSPETGDMEQGLRELQSRASEAVRSGAEVLILSDRFWDPSCCPIPALLASSAVHHALMREGLRASTSLVIESGEPREVHHFALLFGYGASAVYPYFALELVEQGQPTHGFLKLDPSQRSKNFRKAIEGGLLKIMSKMGISTLRSYQGAQIFEALGLTEDFVSAYFPWTPTRIEGADLKDFAEDSLARFHQAHRTPAPALPELGLYTWRREGEKHLHEPQMITQLQAATRIKSREEFQAFCERLDTQQLNLRSLLQFKSGQTAIPLEEVEPVTAIVKRFATGAMSFGSISKETHETIAIAMNRMGARSNSGEGGEDATRYERLPNGDSRRSAIKQVASGRFGVTSHYLVNADEIQIKMAQGAKPGEGGQLPGDKVDAEIGRVRHSTPGITLISPPPHHDIYSIEDLAQLIFDLKNANYRARINVKLVSEVGVGTVAAGVAKAKADAILISGYEGGTGASPLSSIRHAGLPWELGLSEAHRALVDNQLRSRVTLQTDGQLRTPRDIAIAALLGAEEWGIGTGALIVLGCIMMRKCHLNTCPVGIATQDEELRARFRGQPEHLINYIFLLAEGLREIMAQLGLRTVSEMVGRVDLLEKKSFAPGSRLDRIRVDALLRAPRNGMPRVACKSEDQQHGVLESVDAVELVAECKRALDGKGPVFVERQIVNTQRALGTLLSSEISLRHGAAGLKRHAIHLGFTGIGGQSFMAFAVQGLQVRLEGEVNDYCGKGLSGATVAIVPPDANGLQHEVICGNVALYGATSGALYVRGSAGERFAVRNSGAHAVVEGLGDHGCEYMTGGSVIVLGPVGRNFGAGMSGGSAFLYDRDETAHRHINSELLAIERGLDEEDEALVLEQLEEHLRLTGSPLALSILDHWEEEKNHFLSAVPFAYRQLKRQSHASKRLPREREQGGLHG